MDFYTHLSFKVQKGRGLGSRDPISKFWDPPYTFGTNRDICFKFGTDIEDGPPTASGPGGRGLGHDQISKFWDPYITFE